MAVYWVISSWIVQIRKDSTRMHLADSAREGVLRDGGTSRALINVIGPAGHCLQSCDLLSPAHHSDNFA